MKRANTRPARLPDPAEIIRELRAAHHQGIYASQGAWYSQSVFGRDSLLTARMLLKSDRELANEVIFTIASLQGLHKSESTQEQLGRVHHEYRRFSDWRSGRPGKRLAQFASLLWGGSTSEMLTYFSTDGTALYLQLAADYCAEYGSEILQQTVTHHSGQVTTVGASIAAAAGWLLHRAGASGYVEHRRSNPFSVINQTWKDSPTAYVHPDGGLPNFRQPVTYLLAQVLAADGLEMMAPWMQDFPECDTASWLAAAQRMRSKTLGEMWMPEHNFFASMLDRDNHQQHRHIATLASDAAWMLASNIFDHLTTTEKRPFLEGIIERLFSDDFLTPVGIRCRAKRHIGLIDFADYHGAWTVWGIDNYFFALGLHKHGYHRLAREIELRFFNGFNAADKYYEYFLVSADDVVLYQPQEEPSGGTELVQVQIRPEPNLAWSVASFMHLQTVHESLDDSGEIPDWKHRFEGKILGRLPYSLALGDAPPPQTNLTPFRLSTGRGISRLAFKIVPELLRQYVTPRNMTN